MYGWVRGWDAWMGARVDGLMYGSTRAGALFSVGVGVSLPFLVMFFRASRRLASARLSPRFASTRLPSPPGVYGRSSGLFFFVFSVESVCAF